MPPPRLIVTVIPFGALLAALLVVSVTVSAAQASGTPALTRQAREVGDALTAGSAARSSAALRPHLAPDRSIVDARVERALNVLRSSLRHGAVVSKVEIDGDTAFTEVFALAPGGEQVAGTVLLRWRRATSGSGWHFDPLAGP